MLTFILGLFVGSISTLFTMCLMNTANRADQEMGELYKKEVS
ncbi:DUF3789 domain-containing protein [Bacillus sp. BRMEA1]|nr:DUF3789 domain-containing protein [Neobacillus endophyticus]NRD76938.1 DUF3789 domain-containing protein [Neobacillus endophyticus]